MKTIGDNIKELRKLNSMTQAELAEKLGVSFKTIGHWENNYAEPSVAHIKMMKEIFECTYDDLFDID